MSRIFREMELGIYPGSYKPSRNYDPYPCGGGNVEKLAWEERHGWTEPKFTPADDYVPDWKRQQELDHLSYYDNVVRDLY